MTLQLRLDNANGDVVQHDLGDEIWEEGLDEAIRTEAAALSRRLHPGELSPICRERWIEQLADEMRESLKKLGDSYKARDGTTYRLVLETSTEPADPGTIGEVSAAVVIEVLRFEELPIGSIRGDRCAIVRWSDGTEGEALRWFSEEVLLTEGDLLGKTHDQLRSLHFRRDRQWLQS